MLNDVLKVYVYGYVKDISYTLDLVAVSQKLEIDLDINENKKDKNIKENDQDIKKNKINTICN